MIKKFHAPKNVIWVENYAAGMYNSEANMSYCHFAKLSHVRSVSDIY